MKQTQPQMWKEVERGRERSREVERGRERSRERERERRTHARIHARTHAHRHTHTASSAYVFWKELEAAKKLADCDPNFCQGKVEANAVAVPHGEREELVHAGLLAKEPAGVKHVRVVPEGGVSMKRKRLNSNCKEATHTEKQTVSE